MVKSSGTFEVYSAELIFENGAIVGVSGVIDASSVKSDSTRLDGHLKVLVALIVQKCVVKK